jgi:hypothetical protein
LPVFHHQINTQNFVLTEKIIGKTGRKFLCFSKKLCLHFVWQLELQKFLENRQISRRIKTFFSPKQNIILSFLML